jgi:hypothetical protein
MGVTNVTELAKTVADSTLYFLCLFFFANFRFALLLKKYNDGFCCLFDPVYKNYCAAKTALTRKPKLPYKKCTRGRRNDAHHCFLARTKNSNHS